MSCVLVVESRSTTNRQLNPFGVQEDQMVEVGALIVVLFVATVVRFISVRRASLAGGARIRFHCAVRGESFYQDNIRRVAMRGKNVDLIPEPGNPHDKNAIRIDVDGRTIGYIPRESAKEAREHQWKAVIATVNSGRHATGIVLGITETYRDRPNAGTIARCNPVVS
jgi:hypothetical protein